MVREKILTVTIHDCEVQAFRAGGPGGQKQNKTSSAVRVKHPHVKAYLFKVYDGKAIWKDCLRAVKPSASSEPE